MNNKNENIDIVITAGFNVNSVIDRKASDEHFNGDFKHYVLSFLLEDESLFGVI